MTASQLGKIESKFIGKTVRSFSCFDNEFTIFFTDDSYIEVGTDDEPLEYDVNL